ncbi:uncharacterized protein LOC144321347 [Canis aureus]
MSREERPPPGRPQPRPQRRPSPGVRGGRSSPAARPRPPRGRAARARPRPAPARPPRPAREPLAPTQTQGPSGAAAPRSACWRTAAAHSVLPSQEGGAARPRGPGQRPRHPHAARRPPPAARVTEPSAAGAGCSGAAGGAGRGADVVGPRGERNPQRPRKPWCQSPTRPRPGLERGLPRSGACTSGPRPRGFPDPPLPGTSAAHHVAGAWRRLPGRPGSSAWGLRLFPSLLFITDFLSFRRSLAPVGSGPSPVSVLRRQGMQQMSKELLNESAASLGIWCGNYIEMIKSTVILERSKSHSTPKMCSSNTGATYETGQRFLTGQHYEG